MALPSPRNKILPLRGLKSALTSNLSGILEGEFCYATDEDQYYQKENGVLVAVGATKAQGALADSAVQPTDSIDVLADVDTSTVAPTDGQVLAWVNANSQWEPAVRVQSNVTTGGTGSSAISNIVTISQVD